MRKNDLVAKMNYHSGEDCKLNGGHLEIKVSKITGDGVELMLVSRGFIGTIKGPMQVNYDGTRTHFDRTFFRSKLLPQFLQTVSASRTGNADVAELQF
ncbi:TPA: hypothetical protein EYP38_04005 [Candidatus Micrarchaeota archaeon]|nr:hypothetical protein [Candidatus Micrarchaeota archaeon]